MGLFLKIISIVFFSIFCFLLLLVAIVFVIGMLYSLFLEYKQYRITHKRINKYEKLFPWVDVADCLPFDVSSDGGLYLVITDGYAGKEKNIKFNNSFELCRYSKKDGWYSDYFSRTEQLKVKYWMPLPDAPDEVTK